MFHLVTRFFGFLTTTAPSPRDQLFVSRSLTPRLRDLFYTQRVEDQRHAIDVASRVPSDSDLIEAALLHDIGKSTVDLGAIGRSLATLWSTTSLPIWGSWLSYRDHGPIGAELLERNGAGALAVSFTRHHPGRRPPWVDEADWIVLERADAGG